MDNGTSFAGFLQNATSTAKDIGLAVTGFLDTGLTVAESVKTRVDAFKGTFTEDDLPKAQKSTSVPAFIENNKDSLLVYSAIGIIGVAILFSAVSR